MPHRQGIGAIYGIVTEDGAPARKRIVLMDRTTLSVVARTVSDENGAYAFTGLNPDTNDYLALAVDDDGAPCKEAICHDYLQPVPAHQGATFWGNWGKRALRDYPVAGWMGTADGGGAIHGLTTPIIQEGSAVALAQSITQGAPHLASLDLTAASIAFAARPDNKRSLIAPLCVSLEWVFARGENPIGVLATSARANQSITTNAFFCALAVLHYDPATQRITAYNNNNNSSSSSGASRKVWQDWREIGFTDLSGAGEVVHVVLTIEYGFEARLYVDGALAEVFLLAGQNDKITYAQNCVGALVFGEKQDNVNQEVFNSPATARTGSFLIYEAVLPAEAVAARYADLMVGTSPAETGYAKEVLLDAPLYLYRLNEADAAGGFADWLTDDVLRVMQVFSPEKIATSQAAPVTGQSAARFNGGAAKTDFGVMQSASQYELTFDFWLTLNEAPTAMQYIVANTDVNNNVYSGVSVGADGKLTLHTRESSAAKTVTFAPALAAGVTKHVAVTLDKRSRTARLYLDGALADTQSTTATLLDAAPITGNTVPRTHIGGMVNAAASSAENTLRATLSDVALYPRALSASRILAHFSAASTL